jgi:hypothetical protein
MQRSFISLLLACACACGSDDVDDGVATTQAPASQSSTQATSSSPETGDSSSGSEGCTSYLDTFEGCGVNGCAAGPTNLNGTVSHGGACAMAPECVPALCTCASDASVQWFAASCGCGTCMDDAVACERTKGLVACGG